MNENSGDEFDLKEFIPAQLGRLSKLTQALLADALSQCDLTIPHWRAFICLVNEGPSTLNEIVDFTKIPQSTLSRSIMRMEEKGLVKADREPSDRRRMRIDITPTGRERFAQAVEIVDERVATALKLSPEDMRKFSDTVRYLIEILSDT